MWPLASLALGLVAAACSPDRPEGRQLAVTVVAEPVAQGEAPLARRLADQLTMATLIERDSDGELVAGLASSWRFVDDGSGLILRLRPARWSDDKPLVAADVVAGFRRAARPPLPMPAYRLAGIEGAAPVAAGRSATQLGVKAPIARVVEIRLASPSPLLLGWLAEPGFAVRRAGEATLARYALAPAAEASAGDTPPKAGEGGPGPIRLTRRAREASADALPAEVTIRTVADPSVGIAGFRSGKADIVIGEGLTGLLDARIESRRQTLRLDPVYGLYGWRANALRGPLADPALRRMLAARIDREALARSFGLAAVQPEAGLLPAMLRTSEDLSTEQLAAIDMPAVPDGPAVPGVLAGPAAAPAAPAPLAAAPSEPAEALAAAQALVRAASLKAVLARSASSALPPALADQPPPLKLLLLLSPGREHRLVAERVAAGWRALGVELVVREADAATRARLVARGEFDLALDEASLGVADPAALLDRFRCDAGPHCNLAADALLAAARMAPPAERGLRLALVEQALMDGPPLFAFFNAVRWALVAPGLSGWRSNPGAHHPLGRVGQ